MSDSLRKGLGEQTKEKVTPDSQKTTAQVVSESVTGAADKVAAAVQPQSEKSTTQKAGDSVRGNADSAQKEGSTYLEQAQEIVGNVAHSVSETLISAADAVTGTAKETTDSAAKKADSATK